MLIGYKELQPDTLKSIVEGHLLSGADQFNEDLDIATHAVIDQIKRGEIVIEFCQIDQTVVLKKKADVEGVLKVPH